MADETARIAAFLREHLRVQVETEHEVQSESQRVTVRLMLGEEEIAEDHATVFIPEPDRG